MQQWRYYLRMNTIKSIRERLGITQSTLAEGMGCTQGNVGHYEHGQTVPPDAAKRLITYAKTLGHDITYDDIYGAPAPASTAQEAIKTVAQEAIATVDLEATDQERREKERREAERREAERRASPNEGKTHE